MVDRVLDRRELTPREEALWTLVDVSCEPDEARRRAGAERAHAELGADGSYLASMVIALFKFYNAFVDLNGVAELSDAGYEASGRRLCTQGYAPPQA